jgi:urease accessory protein
MILRRIAAPLILLASAGPALAHTGHGAGGLVHGFAHPLGGIDHVLAMVAVGLYAAMLGGRALWLVPAAFVSAMAAGGVLGMAGYGLLYTEIGIAVSVIVFGLAIAFRINLPTLVAIALAAVFAIFHGHAHGAEMPPQSPGLSYALGFLLTTALLHGFGIVLGVFSMRGRWRIAQAAGAATALAGIALLMAN